MLSGWGREVDWLGVGFGFEWRRDVDCLMWEVVGLGRDVVLKGADVDSLGQDVDWLEVGVN